MNFSLAFKLLWRDWRGGELTLLLASLIIAVTTVTTITLFVDRLQQALIKESATFLGADRIISSAKPAPQEWITHAKRLGLDTAESLSFLSMVFADERAQFSSVKAVSAGLYPLRGSLIVSDAPFTRGIKVNAGPPPGEVWLESRLIPSLDIQVGDLLDVGVATFVVTKALIKEPDRGGGFTGNLGPRVLMNLMDVAKTEVVQPGSRISYRYLFSGDSAKLEDFDAWVKPKLGLDYRFYGMKEGSASIGNALERAESFLLLGGLLGVILAGVAIALAAQRYSLRHYDHVAILKTLGATPARVDFIYLTIFLSLGVFGAILGSLIGWGVQLGVVELLAPFIPIELPAPGVRPLLIGFVTGMVCLLSFALPPILRLRAISPMRVIRRDLGEQSVSDKVTYLFGLIGTLALLWWYSNDLFLTMMIFGGATLTILVLGSAAYLLLRSGRILGMQAGSVWRLALAGLQRRGQANTLQILVFGLAIMLLLILILVRTALVDEWRAQLPEDAPNHFVINISPEDVEPIRQMLEQNHIDSGPLYPMIRGRIVKVNGEVPVRPRYGVGEGSPRTGASRNLTWSALLPPENRLVKGKWWQPADYVNEHLVSLEEDYARFNNLKIGDKLTFEIRDQALAVTVSNIRGVSWDNMRPNFYIVFSPGTLDDFPSTFMTSFYLEREQKLFLNSFLRKYPTITVLEVDAIIEQIQTIISQVTLAIELVLVLILVAGGLVLLASIQASMDERLQQHAILRTLGASSRLVLGSLMIEFAALGLFAGILATVGSEITVFGLETQIFDLDYSPHLWLWGVGPLIGMVLIGVVGTLSTRRVVKVSPITILRELG